MKLKPAYGSCLRLLLAGLTNLEVLVPVAIVDDAAWARLVSLSQLELTWLWEDTPSAHKGSGLAALEGLQTLTSRSDQSNLGQAVIDAASFTQPSIIKLDICGSFLQLSALVTAAMHTDTGHIWSSGNSRMA